MRILNCIEAGHNFWLVAIAAVVCTVGGWVGLHLLRRAGERRNLQKWGWVFLASFATGCTVWCTHFIAMLAYKTPVPVTFEPILTFCSLLLAVAGSALSISLALRSELVARVAGGAILGLAIAAMHYTGMLAYHVPGWISWDLTYVAASVALAVGLGMCAVSFSVERPAIALVMFVLTVTSLHFVGMTAVTVVPMGDAATGTNTISAMAVAIAGAFLLIVGTAMASSLIDRDQTEKSIDALRKMALSDALTGLPNRQSFLAELGQLLEDAQCGACRIGVVAIDLDGFKEVNDMRGHAAGDQVLRTMSERLKSILKSGEYLARIGGDEFAAAKTFSEHADLVEFASRLKASIHQRLVMDEFSISIGASIGVAIYPDHGQTSARLMANADMAMYRAKADCVQKVCFYEPVMEEAARKQRELARDLRLAIARNELSLHYQVQQDIGSRAVVGYEALLRWKHPVHGNVPPSTFIPMAEGTGAILAIGEWVLREACTQAAKWTDGAKVAVNISAVQLAQADLPAMVLETLVTTGLSPSRLELEMTETAIVQDKVKSLDVFRRIRALGVTIALDDFGTGYASFETLCSFPFDRIKLDRSFVGAIEHSAQARAVVRAVLALGESLQIGMLAEGVETETQLALLRHECCKAAQGYYLGRPVPAEEIGAVPASGQNVAA